MLRTLLPFPVLAALLAGAAPAGAQETAPTQPESHRRMVALLGQIAAQAPAAHRYTGDGPAAALRAELAELPIAATGPQRWLLLVRLAGEELRLGDEEEAVRLLSQARDIVPRAAADRSWLDYTEYRLGIAWLRLGETANCALHASAESCILPLQGGGIHRDQEPSRQAIEAFTRVLDGAPAADEETLAASAAARNLAVGAAPRDVRAEAAARRLAARWLLNLAWMTVGGYPDEVPPEHRIPPAAFGSAADFPRFHNVAPALGLATFDMCGGAIADDFNGDGYLDLVTASWDPAGQLRYFRNDRRGGFIERTAEAGLRGIAGGLNLVQADYDNDGHVDILVLRGAWLGAQGRHPNSLLRNNGDGTFSDVTFDAGLGEVHYPTQTAAWADYDNDGHLDLYVGNETSRSLVAPSQLFRNNGDGTFTDVAASAGVLNHRFAKAVAWGDYDDDGLADLYVSNSGGANRLYRNTGRGTFRDEARRLRVTRPHDSFPAWFWDADNDGVLDLYVAAYSAGIEHLAADALGLPVGVERARLYRGTGDGRFEDVSEQYGLRRPVAPMGANFGDLDNDGWLDFYLGTGYPPYHSLMPNRMFRNEGGRRFADITGAGGFGHLQKGHAVVFADLDHDGDADIFEQMGGAFPGDRAADVLYENPGSANHWLTVRLVGTRSNRSAIGARIRVDIIEDGRPRSVYRHVNSGGSFGANPLRQTIGLGSATQVETLEILWPATGKTQTFTEVAADQTIRIVEGDPWWSPLPMPPVEFASQPAR